MQKRKEIGYKNFPICKKTVIDFIDNGEKKKNSMLMYSKKSKMSINSKYSILKRKEIKQ